MTIRPSGFGSLMTVMRTQVPPFRPLLGCYRPLIML
jgi:hypothetical protein